MKQGITRFYKEVHVIEHENGYSITLDDKTFKSEDGHDIAHPSHALMQAIAEEWRAQGEMVDFLSMPLMRLLGAVIDCTDNVIMMLRGELLAYALNDTLCYHQEGDSTLATQQCSVWGTWLDWAKEEFGAEWIITHDIMPLIQPDETAHAATQWVEKLDTTHLVLLYMACQSLSSFIMSAALLRNACNVEEALASAWLEHDEQMRQWGEDPELIAKRELAAKELQAAMRFYTLIYI